MIDTINELQKKVSRAKTIIDFHERISKAKTIAELYTTRRDILLSGIDMRRVIFPKRNIEAEYLGQQLSRKYLEIILQSSRFKKITSVKELLEFERKVEFPPRIFEEEDYYYCFGLKASLLAKLESILKGYNDISLLFQIPVQRLHYYNSGRIVVARRILDLIKMRFPLGKLSESDFDRVLDCYCQMKTRNSSYPGCTYGYYEYLDDVLKYLRTVVVDISERTLSMTLMIITCLKYLRDSREFEALFGEQLVHLREILAMKENVFDLIDSLHQTNDACLARALIAERIVKLSYLRKAELPEWARAVLDESQNIVRALRWA